MQACDYTAAHALSPPSGAVKITYGQLSSQKAAAGGGTGGRGNGASTSASTAGGTPGRGAGPSGGRGPGDRKQPPQQQKGAARAGAGPSGARAGGGGGGGGRNRRGGQVRLMTHILHPMGWPPGARLEHSIHPIHARTQYYTLRCWVAHASLLSCAPQRQGNASPCPDRARPPRSVLCLSNPASQDPAHIPAHPFPWSQPGVAARSRFSNLCLDTDTRIPLPLLAPSVRQAAGSSPPGLRPAGPLLLALADADGDDGGGQALPLEGQAVPLPRSGGGGGGGGGGRSSRLPKLKSSWAAEREALMAEWGQFGISGLVLAS